LLNHGKNISKARPSYMSACISQVTFFE